MSNLPPDNGPTLDRRFKLGKVIGRGPSGVVYSATDLQSEQPCAVKRLHAHFYNRQVLQRVQRDALAAAKLGHPSILAPYHVAFEPSGSIYLVSHLIQGESLLTRLQRGPLSLTAALGVFDPLCAALQAAHEAGLGHGAITPSNILCVNSGRVMVSDFGMCHLRGTPKIRWGGAMGYSAPESFDEGGELSSPRGDVFSLGALVFECLTGQRMFSSTSLATFLASVATPPRLGALLPMYAHLDAVLEMACVQQTNDRFANAGALWRALQSSLLDGEAAQSAALSDSAVEPVAPPKPSPLAEASLPELVAALPEPAPVTPLAAAAAAMLPITDIKVRPLAAALTPMILPVGESSDGLHPVPLPPPPALSTPVKGLVRGGEPGSGRAAKMQIPLGEAGTPSGRTLPRGIPVISGDAELTNPGRPGALRQSGGKSSPGLPVSRPAEDSDPFAGIDDGELPAVEPVARPLPVSSKVPLPRQPQLSPVPLPPLPSSSPPLPPIWLAESSTALPPTMLPAPPLTSESPSAVAPPQSGPPLALPPPAVLRAAAPPAVESSPLNSAPTMPLPAISSRPAPFEPAKGAASSRPAIPPVAPRPLPSLAPPALLLTPAVLAPPPAASRSRSQPGLPGLTTQPTGDEGRATVRSLPQPARPVAPSPPLERSTEQLQTLRVEARRSGGPLDRVWGPLFWATVGGIVVGSTMLGLQWLAGGSAGSPSGEPLAGLSQAPSLRFDEDAMLKAALQHMAQRSYQSALSAAELVLRAHPDNARARRLADQTSELLRASAVYGGFLRAADKQDGDSAAALYAELAPDSPFRVNAWEPFMPVRNQYVNRHLNLASAAGSAGECELIAQQLESLRKVMDSDRDPDLLQGQRMLDRCRRIHGGSSSAEVSAASSAAAMAEAAAPPSEGREPPAEPTGLRDPFAARPESREPVAVADKPKKVARKRAAAKPAVAPATAPAVVEAPKPPEKPPEKALPSTLRNPFGP